MRALAHPEGATFAFSTEKWIDCPDTDDVTVGSTPGYMLLPTKRFAHSQAYVRATAQRHGFKVICNTSIVLAYAPTPP